jgi:hypothetical protein
MDDGLGKIKVISDHFNASTSSVDSQPNRTSSVSDPQIDNSSSIGLIAGPEDN